MLGGSVTERAEVDRDRGASAAAHTAPCGAESRAPAARPDHARRRGRSWPGTARRTGWRPPGLPEPPAVIPSSYARRSDRAERWIPSRASASLNGLARRDSKGSITCASASIPLAAIVALGRPDQQVGVDDRDRGQHQRTAQARLDPAAGQHGVAGHLRARAGGGGHRHARQARAADDRSSGADHLEVIERVSPATSPARRPPSRRPARSPRRNRPPRRSRSRSAEPRPHDRSIDGSARPRKPCSRCPRSASATPERIGSCGQRPGDHQHVCAPSPASASGSSVARPAPNRMSAGVGQVEADSPRYQSAVVRRGVDEPGGLRADGPSSAPPRRASAR